MTQRSFSLIPFPNSNIPEINISGTIARENNFLQIHYSLSGKTETILFPERSRYPSRKDELWKATCFEFFVALPDKPQYWEFNMSSSGDWNVYHMDSYRRVGFREETTIQQLIFSVKRKAECIFVETSSELSLLIPVEQPIQVGITCIVQTKDGHETYWALIHPNPPADFHLRESFIIPL